MVTGVETAGLVLGSIPLILAGLEFYARGIATAKRCWKYKEQFQGLIREIQTENAICTNSINLLLIGVVKSKDMADFLADPRGSRWKDTVFEQRLRQRLSYSYDSYLATIEEICKTAEEFKKRLKLDASGKPQFTDETLFKKCYKKLELGIRKTDYDDLMTALRRANSSLHRLTTQSISLENMQSSCKLDKPATPKFNAIHERAQGFYAALCSSWKCPCHADHSVSLRLEPRIDEVHSVEEDSDEENETMKSPFHVIFRYSHEHSSAVCSSKAAVKPWLWEEADVQITVTKQVLSPSASGGSTTLPVRAKVHFPTQAKKAVSAALKPNTNLQPIRNLCAAISTLQNSQREACLSLLAHEYAKQKYGILIYPSKDPPCNPDTWSTSSLRNILNDPNFARRDRLNLSVTLSSSVLQLHDTAWLDEDWDKEDILFVQRDGKTAYQHPFVSRHTHYRSRSSSTVSSTAWLRKIIRNQTLYALGISLIELWYGKGLSELHKPEDGPLGDAISNFNTADRLVDELYNEAGGKYSDAVRRCIRCDFDRRANSLEDLEFQKAVYEGVVAQLKENYDFLY